MKNVTIVNKKTRFNCQEEASMVILKIKQKHIAFHTPICIESIKNIKRVLHLRSETNLVYFNI